MATIQKRGNSYKITVSCGYDLTGKQIRRHKTFTPDKGMTEKQVEKAVQREAVLFEESCKTGKAADGNVKFEAFTEQWFREYAEPKLKKRSIDRYRQFTKRVYTAMGHLRMDKITTRSLQAFVMNLSEDGMNERTGGGLSAKTIKDYVSFVSSVFDYAVSQGVISSNPCRGVSLPSIHQTDKDFYSLEETERFLELLESESLNWRLFFTLAIYGGFRRGELFGLEWKDIDFDSGVITVNRTSNYTVTRGVFTDTPKTKGSRRSLKMPDCVMQLLRQYRSEQAAARLQTGDQWQESDRLFVSWNGKPMHPNRAQNWLTNFCNRTGMRHVNIHSFRHLNASLLINSGADIKTVSSALGHAQTTTTLNIYAHTFAAAQAKASEAVANALDFKKIRAINTK